MHSNETFFIFLFNDINLDIQFVFFSLVKVFVNLNYILIRNQKARSHFLGRNGPF